MNGRSAVAEQEADRRTQRDRGAAASRKPAASGGVEARNVRLVRARPAAPSAARRELGRRAGRDEQLVRALEPARSSGGKPRRRRGRGNRACRSPAAPPSSRSARRREPGARPGLHRSERDAQEVRDLALREPAPVRELDHVPLMRRKLLERAVDAPGRPARLGALGRAGVRGGRLRHLGRRLRAGAAAVDDRVARDRVEPGRDRAALGPVAATPSARPRRTSPERRPRPGRGRRAAGAQAEHGARVALVEGVERVAVAVGDAGDQLAVGRLECSGTRGIVARRRADRLASRTAEALGGSSIAFRLTGFGASRFCRICWPRDRAV